MKRKIIILVLLTSIACTTNRKTSLNVKALDYYGLRFTPNLAFQISLK